MGVVNVCYVFPSALKFFQDAQLVCVEIAPQASRWTCGSQGMKKQKNVLHICLACTACTYIETAPSSVQVGHVVAIDTSETSAEVW
jgi:hypothetical protein